MNLTSYQNKDLNPTATSSDFIWIKDKSLSKSFCKKMIEKYEKSKDKHEGLVGIGRVDKSLKQTRDLSISNFKDKWQKEDEHLFQALRKGLNEYCTMCSEHHYNLTVSEDVHEMIDTGYMIQKYEPGGFYDWHQDWTIIGSGTRLYTFIWYLNTIKKSDGGWTEFIDGTKIQPKAGKLVMFPATWTYLHRAYPPKVPKYIVTGWIYAKSKDEKTVEEIREEVQKQLE